MTAPYGSHPAYPAYPAYPPYPPFPPQPPAPTRGPSLAWLWLGVAAVVLAVLVMVVFVAVNARAMEAASVAPEHGDSRVTIELYEGHRYGLFVPAENAGGATLPSCNVIVDGRSLAQPVQPYDGGLDGPDRQQFGRAWTTVGSFESPVDGPAPVQCGGVAGGLMVQPDDDVFLAFGLLIFACGALGLAGLILAVVIGVVRASRRRAAGPWGPVGGPPVAPTGYTAPGYGYGHLPPPPGYGAPAGGQGSPGHAPPGHGRPPGATDPWSPPGSH